MKLVVDNVLDPSEEVSNVFLITKQFKTTTDFSIHVEKQAKETQVSCMDVLVEYCIKRDLDIESVATIITSIISISTCSAAYDQLMSPESQEAIKDEQAIVRNWETVPITKSLE